MTTKSPIFPMPDPQHFSDYGFDPQLNYFQVLEEAMKHKRHPERSIDSIRFKLHKPDIPNELHSISTTKKPWWKNLFKWKWTHRHRHRHHQGLQQQPHQPSRASISGPVYFTHTRTGPTTSPYRTTARPCSGPLAGAGTLTPTAKGVGHVGVPYPGLRELNMEQQRMSTSALPVYLVT
ncbi:hypothetical protein HN51_063805 [Arachis hypogaea]|uniref:Uncharacterized protein n=2 Tax=Arachis TaxID=3817 RepID=A0A445AWQ0_ARAHY|nr:uncharacterized protein LOC107463379 [Arachis duranensis]XP_020960721.1 uncharacterized protein LOC107620064 [Arachis ipaensis]XP_025630128.1 uncharacterized protein LOC112723105 [Arachis hypogaea]XP_057728770.1 uncharacterized protein LOC130944454 [Arachis stenosperma]QHO21410.1 uncharacterized protein DS421_11g346420 [Arachis hypogaea]RYR30852.1 hypothetical protein Ahy_B01g055623 [Arachis hypogaea]